MDPQERAPFNCGRWLKLLRGGCSPHLKMLVFRAYIYIFGLLPCSEQHMLVLFEHGKSPKIYMYTLKTASALALKMGSIPETLPPTPIKGGALRGGLFEQGKSPKIYMYTFKTWYIATQHHRHRTRRPKNFATPYITFRGYLQ